MCMLLHHLVVWWLLLFMVSGLPNPVLSVVSMIIKLIVMKNDPPFPRWYRIGMLVIRERGYPLTDILLGVLNVLPLLSLVLDLH